MLRPPATALPDPRAEVTQRQMQPGQVTASSPLPCRALAHDWLAGDVAGQAIPQAVLAYQFTDRARDRPSGTGEVTEHGMLIRQLLRVGPPVVAAQHGTLPAGHLNQPVAVARRDILQHGNPASPHAQRVQHAGHNASHHRGHPIRAIPRHNPPGARHRGMSRPSRPVTPSGGHGSQSLASRMASAAYILRALGARLQGSVWSLCVPGIEEPAVPCAAAPRSVDTSPCGGAMAETRRYEASPSRGSPLTT